MTGSECTKKPKKDCLWRLATLQANDFLDDTTRCHEVVDVEPLVYCMDVSHAARQVGYLEAPFVEYVGIATAAL